MCGRLGENRRRGSAAGAWQARPERERAREAADNGDGGRLGQRRRWRPDATRETERPEAARKGGRRGRGGEPVRPGHAGRLGSEEELAYRPDVARD